MGIKNTKSSFRNAIVHLNISAENISVHDEKFWSQIWLEDARVAAEIIRGTSTQETRILRDGSPRNFATLTYKMVERLKLATGTICNTQSQQTAVLNASRILTRLIPCIFEDKAWRNFFLDNVLQQEDERGSKKEPELLYPDKKDDDRNYESYLPTQLNSTVLTTDKAEERDDNDESSDSSQVDLLGGDQPPPSQNSIGHTGKGEPLMKALILSICDLLFCPEFTVLTHTDGSYLSSVVDAPPEDLKSLATCDYVWEPGVGFDSSVNSTCYYDKSRVELLGLLLTCMSGTLYETPDGSVRRRNQWIEIFTSNDNRHALPLFTSLLNTVFSFKPSRLSPFNRVMYKDNRDKLVELSIQLLIATLDQGSRSEDSSDGNAISADGNLFIEYLSRIHRDEDFAFIVKGFKRLLNVRLDYSYLLGTSKSIDFDQELLILFWKFCNFNKKFMIFLLKTDDVIDIVVPTLFHLSENFQEPSKTALIHIGVFNLLILSGERNFGVKLNKTYDANSIPNIPAFVGSHADLTILVFHKLILYGLNLNQLYDFMLTIIVNISPYLKSLSLLACKCLIQLFEIFSSPFILLTEPNYHQLIVFLLEVFNNLIQYQFDGNATLVYVILTKKDSFINLANLPSSQAGIEKVLTKLRKKKKKQMLFERQTIEISGQDSCESLNSNSSPGSAPDNQVRSVVSNQQIGATVSSINAESKLNSQQQEVSLVATPDICNVTQAIHPFGSLESPFKQLNQRSNEEPSINFDDAIETPRTNSPAETSGVAPTNGQDDGHNADDTFPAVEQLEEFGLNIGASGSNGDRNKANRVWKATPEWVKRYKSSLPLQSILRMIEVLAPQVEQFKQNDSNLPDENATTKFLQSSTLVGLLPVPHPILIRKYRTNQQTALWFRTCTWGIIFVRNTIWTGTKVRQIKVV